MDTFASDVKQRKQMPPQKAKVKMKNYAEEREQKHGRARDRGSKNNLTRCSMLDFRTISKLYHKLSCCIKISSIKISKTDSIKMGNNWFLILMLLQEFSVIFCGNVPIMSTRIVETRYGKVQGMIYPMDHTKHLKPVEVFLGLPYATPPIRSNRFSPTRTPSPWDGIRIADKLGPVCPQKLPDIRNETAALEKMPKGRLEYLKRLLPLLRNQSEDCLYLNIYSPAQGKKGNAPEAGETASTIHKVGTESTMLKHPVLVFIHGESYDWNSGNPYDGSVIASYAELVVVTLNYRLGILGFLNANVAPHLKARVANYGLMDQIAALHWIQQNIALFGGDPGNVTLLGHGTGAACIHFLMISPTVMPGLFHRTILLSGSALSSWALVEDPVNFATKLARQVNCTLPQDLLREHEKIVDCLREVPLEVLQKADVVAPTYLSAFGPSIDGVVIKTDFQKDMLTYFVPGDVPVGYSSFSGTGNVMNKRSEASMLGIPMTGTNRYDLLFGVVTSEALFRFSAADVSNGFEGERRDRIIRTYIRNAYTYHLSEIFYTVVNEYTDWERTVLHPINTRDATIAALGDAQFVAPLIRTGDLLSSRGAVSSGGPGTKTWFYVFDYQTKDGDYPQRMGTAHGEELPYVFGAPLIEGFNHFPKNYTKSEITLSEAVIIYISNFVRTGNPNDHQRTDGTWNTRERSRFRNIVWDEYDSVHQKYLEIGMKPRMKNHFRAHQLSVWLRLIPELHRAGMEDVVARHNLFRNHNDHDLYDGIVRPDPLSRTNYGLYYNTDMNHDVIFSNGVLANTGHRHHHGTNLSNDLNYLSQPLTTPETLLTTCVSVVNSYPSATHHLGHQNSTDPLANLEAAGYAAYSTALSVTIAIGCSLLILNVLIFAGVYYQRDKTRLEVKSLQQNQRSGVNYDVKPGHYHIGGGSVIVDLEQDTANMILCQNQQRDPGNILLCQNQARFTSSATLPRTSPSHCMQSAAGTMTSKKPTPDISRNNPDIRNSDLLNPDIVKNSPPISSAGILMNAGNKPSEMNHISKSSGLAHMATLPKNITFCNNVTASNINETVISPPNGSATMHMSLPRPPPPPARSPPESQPLLPPKQHPPGSLRVPAAAMNEMRV